MTNIIEKNDEAMDDKVLEEGAAKFSDKTPLSEIHLALSQLSGILLKLSRKEKSRDLEDASDLLSKAIGSIRRSKAEF